MSSTQVRCYRCNQPGHYSVNCPLPKGETPRLHHHATGIPRSHMVEVNKDSKGAMLTSDGKYVVPVMDKKGYEIGKKERPPFVPDAANSTNQDDDEEEPIPDELICLLCKDLLVDAVVIPCCGNSYCDECIRNALLDSESHQCPTCHKTNISPDSLIANKFLRQAVNKFKNDTGIAKKRSNAPVWPRPAPSEVSRSKPVQPMKVSYGPPRQLTTTDRRQLGAAAYVVKAAADQVVAAKAYNIPKRTTEGGSGSPRDPNQPIRIKLGKSDENSPATEVGEVTPSEPKLQSTPLESLPSSTPSDSYTFNSTPDSNDQKAKANISEPLPPGISPPTAKVVRPLMDEETETSKDVEVEKLTGIHPLNQTTDEAEKSNADLNEPVAENTSVPVDAASEPDKDVVSIETEDAEVASSAPAVETSSEPTTTIATSSLNQASSDKEPSPEPPFEVEEPPSSVQSNLDVTTQSVNSPVQLAPPEILPPKPISTTDYLQPSAGSTPPQNKPSIPVLPPSLNIGGNILPLPQTSLPPITVPPPLPLGQHIPGMIPGLPPPPVSSGTTNLFQRPPPPFQHPPPPFGFPMMLPPPPLGTAPFSQPPPGYPAHTASLPPPPGMAIPSLAKVSGLPPPPGSEIIPIPTLKSSASSDRHSSRRDHSPSKNDRSPRKKTDRRSNKSKLDIMSDEFTDKLKKHRGRHARSRSRSSSYSSSYSGSSSSSYSSSQGSSFYSSYSSRRSNSSYSRSPSRSPWRKRHRKQKQRPGRNRRRRSPSWTDRSRSRDRKGRSSSRRRELRKKKDKGSQKRDRRGRSRSRSPRRSSKSKYSARDRRRSPQSYRKPLSPANDHSNTPGYPPIPVITRNEPTFPGLPSKEVADYERDQALYAHYRQAYERDWYERGVMPPPPYDRFIQSRYSKSPSPPGTSRTILPPNHINPSFPPMAHVLPAAHMDPAGAPAPMHLDDPRGLAWDNRRLPPPRVDHDSRSRHHMRPGIDENFGIHARLHSMAGDYSRAVDPKEEQYRMQLSPRSRRRFDIDRDIERQQARDNRNRENYRDGRYDGARRRGDYDDYRNRKRIREDRRASPMDRSSSRSNKRGRHSPVEAPIDGDATPVRDERPPPDEADIIEKMSKQSTTRKAGDLTKVGKKPRRNEKKSNMSERSNKPKANSTASRSPEKKSSSKSSSSALNKSDNSGRSNKRKIESGTSMSSKLKKESESVKRDRSVSKSSRSGDRRSKEKLHKKSDVHSDSPRTQASSSEKVLQNDGYHRNNKEGIPSLEEQPQPDVLETSNSVSGDGTRGSVDTVPENSSPYLKQVTSELAPNSIVKEATPPDQFTDQKDSSKVDVPSDKNQTQTIQPSPKPIDSSERTGLSPSIGSPVVTRSETSDKSEPVKQTITAQSSGHSKSSKTTKPVKPKSNVKSRVKLSHKASKSPAVSSHKEPSNSDRRRDSKRKPMVTSSVVDRSAASPGRNNDVSRRPSDDRQLVEYDGTGPPPTGDELVKITIPKSKWEESDDDSKIQEKSKTSVSSSVVHDVTHSSRRIVKKSDDKPMKGRRIRIKRKPPAVEAKDEKQTLAKSPEEDSKSDVALDEAKLTKSKLVDNKEGIPDARMVITLRRNSKQTEDNSGRRVSMGNPDESHFEPDYSDGEAQVHSPDKTTVAVKGKAVKVTAMRSSSQDSGGDVDQDAIDISDYSNFSDAESEKAKKQAKKKKKKKKKHKTRHRSDVEDLKRERDVSNDRSQMKKSSRRERDDESRDRNSEHISRERETQLLKRGRDFSREKPMKHHSRNRESRHEEKLRRRDSREDSYERIRERDRKHKKHQKRRRRESVGQFSSDHETP